MHIFIHFIALAMEFARRPYRILQINYVDVHVVVDVELTMTKFVICGPLF